MTIIKPLERKNNWSIFIKLLFIGGLMVGTKGIPSILGQTQEFKKQTQEKLVKKFQESDFVNNSIKKVEEVSGTVLGEATDTITKLSSDAGSFISDIIYQNSIGKVVDQIDKLPKDQQEKIKKQICK